MLAENVLLELRKGFAFQMLQFTAAFAFQVEVCPAAAPAADILVTSAGIARIPPERSVFGQPVEVSVYRGASDRKIREMFRDLSRGNMNVSEGEYILQNSLALLRVVSPHLGSPLRASIWNAVSY